MESLHRLISHFQWEAAISRIQSHPEEVRLVHHGENSLITACNSLTGRTPHVELIKTIVNTYPQIIRQKSALHVLFGSNHRIIHPISSSRHSVIKEITNVLIEADPFCLTMTDEHGWLPLHWLFTTSRCNDVLIQPTFLRLMVRPYPQSVAQENKGGVTPFGMFWERFILNDEGKCLLNCEFLASLFQTTWSPSPSHTLFLFLIEVSSHASESERMWKCLLAMLQCWSCYNHCKIDRNSCDDEAEDLEEIVDRGNDAAPCTCIFRPLHTLASWPSLGGACTLDITKLALQIHQSEIQDKDEHGNLPLHCACSTLTTNTNYFDRGGMINILVDKDPTAAAARNWSGQYPIFLAIQSRVEWEYGMKNLLEAYPDVMFEKDPCSGLYPFMMIASLSGEGSLDDRIDNLDCLFEFTRRCPELIADL